MHTGGASKAGQPLCPRQPPRGVGGAAVNLGQHGGGFLQPGVQRHPVVEDKAFALPVLIGVGHLGKVVQDAAVQLPRRDAQTGHPGTGFFTADAAGAVHRHPLAGGLPRGGVGQHVSREITEVADLRVDRAGKTPQPELKAVAVVQQHHVVLPDQPAPGQRADLAAGGMAGAGGIHPGNAQRHDLGLDMHLHAVKRRGLAGAVFEGHAGKPAAKQRVGAQRLLDGVNRLRAARQHAVDALGRHQHAAQHRVRRQRGEPAQARRHRSGLGQRGELVKSAVLQNGLGHSASARWALGGALGGALGEALDGRRAGRFGHWRLAHAPGADFWSVPAGTVASAP